MILRVECYAGYRAEEEPRRFFLDQRKVEVIEIVDRWLAPDYRYFKIRGDDGATYILRYDVPSYKWEMTLFDGRTEDQLRENPAHKPTH